MFSAMHGVYTAFTGGIIGYMKSKSWPYILLSPLAMLPAMMLHAIHNSSELLEAAGGDAGTAIWCIFAPLFDYGGLVVIALAMLIWTHFHKDD
jgi:hypothetical protein